MQILSGGRFRLGLGAGENLNEHVVGQRWPMVGERHELLQEAIEIITALFDADGRVSYRGRHSAGSGSAGRSTPTCRTRPRSRPPRDT